MDNSSSPSNLSNSDSKKITLVLENFNLSPDLESKEKLLRNLAPDEAKTLIEKIPFENFTMILDECPNLDIIFSFLELLHSLKEELSDRLMEYLFLLESTSLDPSVLKRNCLDYLEKNLGVSSFTQALEKLNAENDERKIALLLTDIAIINEEISKRLLWELFSKFKDSGPKHFRDSLKILKWASEDLFLVISIIGTEKLLQSTNLKEFNNQLSLFISEDPDLIYPLIIEVPNSKLAITNLFNNSCIEDILDFLQIIETHSPDYMEALVDFNFDETRMINNFSKAKVKSKLLLLQKVIEYEDSRLFTIFINENLIILKTLIIEIKSAFDLECFYLCLSFFNTIDKLLAQELLININPKVVSEHLFESQNEKLVIDTFIAISTTNNLYLYYSLQAEFTDFIKWLEFFISKLQDLETLALFLVSFQKIFADAPELPLILTTIVKKLQREENLDDLGVFLGIIGNADPDLLNQILNNLLPNLKLYSTEKIGYLLMTTSLYNLEIGKNLVKNLSSRFSSEYDIKLLRKSFESMILANANVAEALLQDENFSTEVLIKNIKNSDILERVLFLETILPIGKEIIARIEQDTEFVSGLFQDIKKMTIQELTKLVSNSRWLNEDLTDELGRILANRNFTLADYYNLIHTSSWSNRELCKKIIYWTNIAELGEKFEDLPESDTVLEGIITILYEIDTEKAEKLIEEYLPKPD